VVKPAGDAQLRNFTSTALTKNIQPFIDSS